VICTSRSKRRAFAGPCFSVDDQLDRGGAAEEGAARAMDGAHAALADLALQRVLAE